MKSLIRMMCLLLFICFGSKAEAVNGGHNAKKIDKPQKTSDNPQIQSGFQYNNINTQLKVTGYTADEAKQSKKTLRKQKRLKRKFQRLQRKLAKWNKASKDFFGGATDNPKFRLGLLCFLGGLGFVILVNILGFLSILGVLGGLLALVGVGLMIWGVLEYTN